MPRLAAVSEPVGTSKAGLRRGLVEEKVLEVSAELFADRGFAATSLQDIADAVGVSRPALYHYVSSKDEILVRLTEGLIVSAGQAISHAMAEQLPADKQLAVVVRALVGPIAESPGRFRLLLTRDASIPPGSREQLRDLERTVARSLTSVIDRGIAEGVFRRVDPRSATFAVIGMINWVAWWYTPGGAQTIEQVSDSLVDMALASLKAKVSARNGGTVADTLASLRRDLDHLERNLKP
jgi:AcrR family transcriptional regulator